MTDAERLEQIRRSHASARPKHDNPAWVHTHNDLTFVLEQLDSALLRLDSLTAENVRLGNELFERADRIATVESILSDAFDHLPVDGTGGARWRAEEYMREQNKRAFAVEKPVRICGVPDPDDECEECHRPLGHDGEHDYTTPPE